MLLFLISYDDVGCHGPSKIVQSDKFLVFEKYLKEKISIQQPQSVGFIGALEHWGAKKENVCFYTFVLNFLFPFSVIKIFSVPKFRNNLNFSLLLLDFQSWKMDTCTMVRKSFHQSSNREFKINVFKLLQMFLFLGLAYHIRKLVCSVNQLHKCSSQ